jgi:hypothetical protein
MTQSSPPYSRLKGHNKLQAKPRKKLPSPNFCLKVKLSSMAREEFGYWNEFFQAVFMKPTDPPCRSNPTPPHTYHNTLECFTMRPRISTNLRVFTAPKSCTRWVRNSSFQPKSTSSFGSSPWPRTASGRYERFKEYQELERMLEKQHKIMQELNAKGVNYPLEEVEINISLMKRLREHVQEDCKSRPCSVDKY